MRIKWNGQTCDKVPKILVNSILLFTNPEMPNMSRHCQVCLYSFREELGKDVQTLCRHMTIHVLYKTILKEFPHNDTLFNVKAIL